MDWYSKKVWRSYSKAKRPINVCLNINKLDITAKMTQFYGQMSPVPPVNYIRLHWKPEFNDKVVIRNQFSTTSILISRTESVEYQIEGSQSFTLVIIWESVYPLIYRDRENSCSKNLMINIGLGSSCIQMMQATNLRDSNKFTFRLWLDLSWIRRILYWNWAWNSSFGFSG